MAIVPSISFIPSLSHTHHSLPSPEPASSLLKHPQEPITAALTTVMETFTSSSGYMSFMISVDTSLCLLVRAVSWLARACVGVLTDDPLQLELAEKFCQLKACDATPKRRDWMWWTSCVRSSMSDRMKAEDMKEHACYLKTSTARFYILKAKELTQLPDVSHTIRWSRRRTGIGARSRDGVGKGGRPHAMSTILVLARVDFSEGENEGVFK
ncbi:hypothetical protein BD410DRAFT_802364 [Rickenella mellea]|uniref:Uncharacterized protein n=1 Tax=Rickenella mellea TaxID=50990 RepID=A0A4Y7Q8S6_9AGAM|nr:hypothetical protein BD410DRAFT_802364 [Rickenella mellea]